MCSKSAREEVSAVSNITKKALADSLLRLLAGRSLDKITIGDIVEDCGVNRQTFYYHFHDVYALMEWIYDEEFAKYADSSDISDNWVVAFQELFAYMRENSSVVLNVYHSSGWEYLESFIRRRMRPAVDRLVRTMSEGMDVDEDDMLFVTEIYISAVKGIADTWLKNGMEFDRDGDADRLVRFVDGSLRDSLAKFDRKNR